MWPNWLFAGGFGYRHPVRHPSDKPAYLIVMMEELAGGADIALEGGFVGFDLAESLKAKNCESDDANAYELSYGADSGH